MKILLSSHFFYPSIGGIEEVSAMLTVEFSRLGHEVRVVTQTAERPGSQEGAPTREVYRQPSRRQLLELVQWCDLFFHNNISLQMAWPLLVVHRPWVVAHHTWIARVTGGRSWQDHLKLFLLRFAANISISQAVADHLRVPSVIIGNPYRNERFQLNPAVARDRDLVFLGRLVSDKGVDVLLQALTALKREGLTPRLTIIGTGPERESLEAETERLGLGSQITFVGSKQGPELAALLNAHQIMVVPSRWQEPFGVVALEGIACGCVPVGSRGGGLTEAIGPCGETFPNGDAQALTRVLGGWLRDPARLEGYRQHAAEHLARHQARQVALDYLRVMEERLA